MLSKIYKRFLFNLYRAIREFLLLATLKSIIPITEHFSALFQYRLIRYSWCSRQRG